MSGNEQHTSGVADKAITISKIEDLDGGIVIGRQFGASTGVPQKLTGANLMSIIGENVVSFGFNASTKERGLMLKFINRTGAASVKGTVCAVSTTTDREVIKQANEYDSICVVQEAGVAEGAEMWCWVNGSVCQVLFKDGIAPVRGDVAIAADTDGRANQFANPGGGLPGVDTHFKEIGHIMESKSSGTDVLALVCLHFN
jgi:hypothetical protein